MDEFPLIGDRSMLLQGHGMFAAEGCHGIRSSSGVLSSDAAVVPAQDDRRMNKGKDTFYTDWPELAGFDNFEPSPRNLDPTFEIGSTYFDGALWSSIFSPGAQLVPSSYFDDIDFSSGRSESTVIKTNPAKTKQQSRNGASDTPLNCDAHASSSSCLSDAELFSSLDAIELANQISAREGLEAIFSSSSQELQVPTASSSICSGGTAASSGFSGPDFVAAHLTPRLPSKKPHDPFSGGAPDMILEGMAENPLDMYFPPLATYEQPEPEMRLTSATTSAQRHRFPEEFAGSSALNRAESSWFGSKEMASAGFQGQPSSASMVLQAVPVKDLGFHKLQEGMNQMDLATKGRIRDALYRLANSVEQRHCVAGGVGSSGSKRFRPGGWAETQTDPMDQSVAQLLLQKPSYRKAARQHRVTDSSTRDPSRALAGVKL